MLVIDDSENIQITRGDYFTLTINAKNSDGTDYTFQIGDVIRFTIYKDKNYSNILLQKDFEVTSADTSVDIEFTSDEMKIGDPINQSLKCNYEIELNPDTEYTQTIVGMTKDGSKDVPKYLYLLPETYEVDSSEE